MADPIAGPRIDSIERRNGKDIYVAYTAMASGYVRNYWFVREVSSTGVPITAWRQATSETQLNGWYIITSIGGDPLFSEASYEVYGQSLHSSGPLTAVGNTKQVGPWTIAAPTLIEATRSSATQVLVNFSGATLGGSAYMSLERRAPGGSWIYHADHLLLAEAGNWLVGGFPTSGGVHEWEVRLQIFALDYNILSPYSGVKTAPAWWQKPPAPTLGTPTRDSSTGLVTVPWSNPTFTPQNTPTGFRYYRARKGQPKPASAWRTVSGTPTSFTDATTTLAHDYTYWVEPYSAAGPSSSAPSVSVDAVRFVPNAATGLTVTQPAPLTGDRHRLAWSITPTTERPVTSQRVEIRSTGTTAWSTLTTVGAATTTVDLDLPVNRSLDVQIVPVNAVGAAASGSNIVGPVVTTPLAPSGVAGSWTSPTALTVVASLPSSPATIGTHVDVEFSTEAEPDPDNPSHWYPGTTGLTISGSSVSWPHTATTSVPHTYRAKARHADSGKISGWVYSALVGPQLVPHPPTLHMPTSVDATGDITVTLTHHPVDGTASTGSLWQYRLAGSGDWSPATGGTTLDSLTWPAGTFANGGDLEVRACTRGAHAGFGDWSEVLLVPLRARPVYAITAPATGVWEAQDVELVWTASEQVGATVALRDVAASEIVAQYSVGPDARSQWFRGLRDGRTYELLLFGRDALQEGQRQQVTLTVDYDLPAPPTLTVTQVDSDDASVHLQATPINELTILRRNLYTGIGAWSGAAGPVTLADGTEAVQIAGSAWLPYDGIAGHWSLLVARAAWSTPAGSSSTLTSTYGTASPETMMQAPGDHFAVLPDLMSVAALGVGLNDESTWYIDSGAPAVLTDIAIIATDDPDPDPSFLDFFDGDSRKPGYVYGWDPDGTSWEAVPDPEGEAAVASTVRIEIWCSDTEDGTYTYCGDTLTDWTYHDRHPRMADIWYKARAYAASGAWAESVPVMATVESRDVIVHYGDDFRSFVKGGSRDLVQSGGGLDVEAVQYEGHRYYTRHASDVPVAEWLDVDLQLLPQTGASSLAEWLEALQSEEILYREPGGVVMRGTPVLASRRPTSMYVQSVAFSVMESGPW